MSYVSTTLPFECSIDAQSLWCTYHTNYHNLVSAVVYCSSLTMDVFDLHVRKIVFKNKTTIEKRKIDRKSLTLGVPSKKEIIC